MSDPIVIEQLSREPIRVEPIMQGQSAVIVLDAIPGPAGPVAISEIAIDLIVDGGGVAITTGVKADIPINWPGNIVGWTLVGDQVGNVVVDILKGDPIHAVPYASITGGAGPSMTAVAAAEGTVVGWTAGIAPGDVLRFQIVSVSTIRRLTIALFVERV